MPPAESGVPMSASERREHVMQLINDKKWSTLLQYDELLDEVRMGRVLHGFRMVIPSFRPTFKVARHTDGTEEDLSVYYNEKRLPAYCDRILWHSLPGLSENVHPHYFASGEDFKSSDHKPVMARFSVVPTAVCGVSDACFLKPQSSPPTRVYPQLKFYDLKAQNLIASDVGFYVKRRTISPALSGDGNVNSKKGGLSISKGKSDPYINFLVNPPELFLEAQRSTVHTRYKTQTLDPQWKDSISVALRINSYEALSHAHIVLLIMDHDFGSADDPIGVVNLSLREICAAADSDSGIFQFDRPVTYFGRYQGRVQGKIQVNTPGPSGKFKFVGRCLETRSFKASSSLGCCSSCCVS